MNSLASVVFGFASGVLLRSLFVLGWPAVLAAAVIALVFFGASEIRFRKEYVLVGFFCIFVGAGILRTTVTDTPSPEPFASEVGHGVSYIGIVAADPDIRDASERSIVRVTENDASTKLLAVARRGAAVSVGDSVRVSGTLSFPKPFESDGGRIFRYDTYLEKDGIRFMIEHAALSKVSPAPWWSVPAFFAGIKHLFIRGLDAVLPEPYASLAGGIVVGGKQGLGKELLAAFTLSGLVQIVVLSGYNVMVVAEAIMAGLARFTISRRAASISGAVAVAIFILIAGAGAATLRAGLMAMIALYARATGRTYAASRALLVVILLMLVWNPLLLVFDPGFDLSVLATAGLIWLAPLLERRLMWIKNAFWNNAVATTLAAQIAVLPMLLYETGNLSLVAIPANLLTLPVVPPAMAFSAIAGIAGAFLGTLVPFLGLAIAFPAYVLNRYIVGVANVAAAIPFSAFTISAFQFWIVMAAYAALVWAAWRMHKKDAAAPGAAASFRPTSTSSLPQSVSQP